MSTSLLYLPLTHFLYATGIFFGSAFLQGLTGFGFVLFSVPMLVLVLGAKIAIPLITCAAFLNAIVLSIAHRNSIRLGEIFLLLPGAFLGIPAGAWFLQHYPESVLRPGLALLIALFALYSLWGNTPLYLKSDRWAFIFGLFAGFTGGAFNANAPPVIIYAQLRQWDQRHFKGSMAVYLVITSLAVMVSHHIVGLSGIGIYITAMELLPCMIIASYLGMRITKRLSTKSFTRVIQLILLILSILLIVK